MTDGQDAGNEAQAEGLPGVPPGGPNLQWAAAIEAAVLADPEGTGPELDALIETYPGLPFAAWIASQGYQTEAEFREDIYRQVSREIIPAILESMRRSEAKPRKPRKPRRKARGEDEAEPRLRVAPARIIDTAPYPLDILRRQPDPT